MQTRMMWTLVVAVAIVTAACGDSKSSLNPTAPSALSADPASAASAEGTSGTMHHRPGHGGGPGNGNGNGHGNGNGNEPRTPTNTSPGPTAPAPPGKAKVEFEGLIQAVSSGSILVNGQVIMVTSDTVIRHGNRRFELSDLAAGDRVHVRASRVSTPTTTPGAVVTATLQATEIMLQNPDQGAGEDTDGLVSVSAFDATATETPVTTGTFRLTRTASATQLALPLTVTYTLGGTATNNTDYAAPLTATFLAGQSFVDVVITPVADMLAEGSETVLLTLTGVAPYELGSPLTATVTITDSLTPQVTVIATDPAATEAPGDTGEFVLTRTGDLTAPLVVTIALNGTATNGTDYTMLSTTVNFLAGEATATLTVTPVNDTVVEPTAETVVLTIVDGAAYDLGPTASATVTISGT